MKNFRFFLILIITFSTSNIYSQTEAIQLAGTIDLAAKNKVKTLVYHKVKDFNRWKEKFEEVYHMRLIAGELSYEVGTFKHDSSMAYIISEWTSAEAFETYMASSELNVFMKKAGVLNTPQFAIFNQKEKSEPMGESFTTLTYHKVEDYDQWKAVFEGIINLRMQAGEISYEIGTFQDDPSVVYVINEWTSIEAFQNCMAKSEIVDAMERAGVQPPVMTLVLDRTDNLPATSMR